MDEHDHVQLRNSDSPKDLTFLMNGRLLNFLVDGADRLFKSRSSLPIGNDFGLTEEPVHQKSGFQYLGEQETDGIALGSIKDVPGSPVKFLAFFTVMVMKLVGWQFNVFVSSVTFPIKISCFAVIFLMFPIRTLERIRGCFIGKLVKLRRHVTHIVAMKVQRSAMRFGFALFWSMYVCFMLLGLLASGFVFGGFVTRRLLEKPAHETKILNFDYTQPSPAAFLPITGEDLISESSFASLPRPIPYNRRLHLTISLQMPESDYNRNLGIFQVKVELLSAHGKVTSSARHPCMLKFKGQMMRFAETIIKSVPLLTGLQSEAQVLDIEMDEFVEGIEPTVCLRVTIEQRAEYRPGTGIPEVYSASLKLESELPLLKMMIWNWRRTVFIWTSVFWVFAELVLILLFCRPMLIPSGSAIFYGKKVTSSPSSITSRCKTM